MYKEHRGGLEIEIELRNEDGVVVSSACCIILLCSVCQSISGINANAPLHIARQFIKVIDGKISLLHRRGDTHKCEMAASTTTHNADIIGIESIISRFTFDDSDGSLQVLPSRDVLL